MERYKNNSRLGLCGAGLIAFALVACGGGSVDSGDLKTEGIHATYRITATSNKTSIDARLTAGGPNGSDVKLSEGDTFTANAYGESIALKRKPSILGAVDSYVGEYDENVSGTLVKLSLTRADNPDAVNSFVQLPEKIVISQGEVEKAIQVGDDYLLVWDNNASGDIEVSRYIACKSKLESEMDLSVLRKDTVADNGEYNVSFDGLLSEDQRRRIDMTKACSGFVSLTRTAIGVLDENLDGGNIKAYQSEVKRFKISLN